MRDFHSAFAAMIAGPDAGPLAIYCNTIAAGLCEALAANFPVVQAMLGDEMFAAVAADHAEAHPPSNPVLAYYGSAFADWIEEQSWVADVPYLSDVARVERLFCEALFAADLAPLDPAKLALLGSNTWSQTRLALHPATRFASSRWPAAALWLAHRDDGNLGEIVWQPECTLVTRPFFEVEVSQIEPSAHRFLLALASGQTLGAAVEATLTAFPDADIAAGYALLLQRGAFAALIS